MATSHLLRSLITKPFQQRLSAHHCIYSSFSDRVGVPSLASNRKSDQVSFPSDSSPSDAEVKDAGFLPSVSANRKVNLPPRMCTLREFGDGDDVGVVAVDSDVKVSSLFQSLAANVEFAARVQDWEILSGRLAMMVFASAVLIEAVTGSSVFRKMDPQRVLEICAAVLASIVVAAGFAVALQAKTRVAYTVSKGYENLMNALIDNVFDSLLFDNEEDP